MIKSLFRFLFRNVWLLWSPLVIGAGMSALGPVLPMVRSDLKINSSEIGISLSISAIVGLVAASSVGRYSDQYGKKQMMILSSLIATGGAILVAISHGLLSFATGYLLYFPGISCMAVVMKGAVSDQYKERRSAMLTRSAVFWNTGSTLCCLLIALFLYAAKSWRTVFFTMFIIYILTSLLLFAIAPEQTHIQQNHTDKKLHISAFSMIIWISLLTTFFLECAISFNTWLTSYLMASGRSSGTLSALAMAAFWFIFTIGGWFKGLIIKYLDEMSVILFSTLVVTSAIFIFCVAPNTYVQIASALLVSFAYATTPVLLSAIVINHEPDTSGTIAGFLQSAVILASIVMQPISGFMIDRFGESQGVFVQGVCAALALLSAVWLQRNLKSYGHLPHFVIQ